MLLLHLDALLLFVASPCYYCYPILSPNATFTHVLVDSFNLGDTCVSGATFIMGSTLIFGSTSVHSAIPALVAISIIRANPDIVILLSLVSLHFTITLLLWCYPFLVVKYAKPSKDDNSVGCILFNMKFILEPTFINTLLLIGQML